MRNGGGTYKMLRVETRTKIRDQCADDVPLVPVTLLVELNLSVYL